MLNCLKGFFRRRTSANLARASRSPIFAFKMDQPLPKAAVIEEVEENGGETTVSILKGTSVQGSTSMARYSPAVIEGLQEPEATESIPEPNTRESLYKIKVTNVTEMMEDSSLPAPRFFVEIGREPVSGAGAGAGAGGLRVSGVSGVSSESGRKLSSSVPGILEVSDVKASASMPALSTLPASVSTSALLAITFAPSIPSALTTTSTSAIASAPSITFAPATTSAATSTTTSMPATTSSFATTSATTSAITSATTSATTSVARTQRLRRAPSPDSTLDNKEERETRYLSSVFVQKNRVSRLVSQIATVPGLQNSEEISGTVCTNPLSAEDFVKHLDERTVLFMMKAQKQKAKKIDFRAVQTSGLSSVPVSEVSSIARINALSFD